MPRTGSSGGSKISRSLARQSRTPVHLGSWTLAVVGAACLLAPHTLGAQSTEQRRTLDQFHDSLTTVTDTLSLLGLESRLIETARENRDDALLHLRLGFLALRLGELGDKSHFDDAAGEFEWAAELEPGWPYPLYGLGLAERELGRGTGSLLLGVKSMLGKDQGTKAVSAFAEAVEREAGFLPALTELAATNDSLKLNRQPDLVLDAYRRATTTAAADSAPFHLFRGRVERAYGDLDSSLAAFRRYLDLGGNRGLALLEIARARLALGDASAANEYYQGAAWNDPVLVALYRSDLSPIAADSQLARFDRLEGAKRAQFLRQFWGAKDAADLRADGERLAEHYRRLRIARQQFRLGPFRRVYDYGERYRSGSHELDDRGIIYVRHGAPVDRQLHVTPQSTAYGSESWVYTLEQQPLAFHFVARQDPDDYRLVDSPLRLPGGAREEFLLRYAPRLLYAQAGRPVRENNLRIRTLRDLAVGTTTDSYELRFERPLDAIAQLVVAGATGRTSHLHIAYAIRGQDLRGGTEGAGTQLVRGWVYPVTLRAAVMDSVGQAVARVDTTVLFAAPARMGDGDHLLGHLAIPVPGGPHTLRFAVSQKEAGGVFPREAIDVRVPGEGDQLTLSDIVVGVREVGLAWVGPAGDSVHFNPYRVFAEGSRLELYYEVYGLTPDAPYETEIKVKRKGGGLLRKIFGGGGKTISIRFSETAVGPVARARRTIDLQGLKSGEYTLTIAASVPGRQPVEREHIFVIQEPALTTDVP